MKRFVSLLVSLLCVFGLTLYVDDAFWANQDPRSILYLPLFIVIAAGINTILNSDEKRLKLFSFIPAAILSLCHLFGSILVKKNSSLWLLKSPGTMINGVISFFSWTVLLYCLIFFCYRALSKKKVLSGGFPGISFLLLWAVLAAAWVPWLLDQYPAVMTADTTDTVEMALGLEPLTNHHPVFYTILVKAALDLGKLISGPDSGSQTGIALFCILQFLGMTAVYAAVLHLILRSSASKAVKTGSLVFFILYPVHALYSVTIWKDVPFAVFILVLTAFLILEMNEHRILYCVGIAVSGFLLSLFRHNGIYLIVLTIPFLPAAFKRHWKQVGLSFLAVLLLFFGWRMMLSVKQIPDGRTSEAFSIPLQQIALTAKRHHAAMEDEILEELNAYFVQPEIWERYSWRISDPVKNVFNETLYKSDPGKFWKFWLKLGLKYPQDYLDGILIHTYGYWYPETPHWVFITGIDDNGLFGIHMDPILKSERVTAAVRWLSDGGYDQIPLLSLCFSPGACFWLYLIFFFYCLYRKSPSFILFIPLFILWLTALASPVNCEFRYVYAMFSCLPLILSALPSGERSE